MPARALVHFLLTTPSRMMGAPDYARHVASAWNAFYEQHALRTIVPRAGANPIRIAGTPHDGTTTWQYLDRAGLVDRKSTRLNSSHVSISYAVFCLTKKNISH